MNQRIAIIRVTAWAVLAVASVNPIPAADSDRSGVIVGNVSNQGTGAYLQGAVVSVEGSTLSAVTEVDGSYRLLVPAGTHTLVASYSGLDAARSPVTAEGAAPARRDFALTSEIYRLSPFVIASEREGNALAVTLQRQAPNVVNVISADAFGSLAGNPADLLQRVPGVTIDLVGGDIRTIGMRGLASELNSVQIDGNRIASVSNDRGFQFQNIGSDHIESMEVVKSPTPDMDADSIGGSVNLKSRSAFNLKGRRFSYSVGGIYGPNRYKAPIPAGSIAYSDVVGVFGRENNLGISVSAGYRAHVAAMDDTLLQFQRTDNAPGFIWHVEYGARTNQRSRFGGGLKLDYKLSPAASVFVNLTYAPHTENAFVPRVLVATAVAGTAIAPGYTENRTQVLPNAASMVTRTINHNERQATAYSVQTGGRFRRDGHDLDWDVSHSFARNKIYVHVANMVVRNVGWIVDRAGVSRWAPRVTFNAGPDTYNLDNYTDNQLSLNRAPTENVISGAQVNYRRDLPLSLPAYLKAGAKIRQETLDRWNYGKRWRYAGPDGRLNSGDERLSQFTDRSGNYEGGGNLAGPMDGAYRADPVIAVDGMRANMTANPGLWIEDVALGSMNPLTGRQTLEEQVWAGYLLGNVRLNRLSVQAGLRIEQTEVEGEGPLNLITPAERARRAAWVGPVTDAETIRRNQAQFGNRRTAAQKYRNVFPGAHLKYEPARGLVLRGSYASTIGRPGYNNIIPNDNVNDDTRVVQVNNAGLKPQFSDNLDASIEYYFEPVGLISAGVFRKDISEYIYSTSGGIIAGGSDNGFGGDYAGYELRSQANGGFARIKGFEINYQQQLTFLPRWWGGFGLMANYTKLETRGDYGSIGNVRSTDSLPGFVPSAANAGISYIRGKLNLRLHWGFNGRTLQTFNAAQNQKVYRVASNRVDLRIKYGLTRRFDAYLDLYNVFNDKMRTEWGAQDRPRTVLDRNDPQIHFGVNGRL